MVREKPEYFGEPTIGRVMRRPVWILALLGCLAVAGVFAWLGQWQLDHAIRTEQDTSEAVTESPRPLGKLTELGTGVNEDAAGMVASVEGEFEAADLDLVQLRYNDGVEGVWVVGNLSVASGGQLAVALGWAPDTESASEARDALADAEALSRPTELVGRYMPPDGPEIPEPGQDPQLLLSMSPAQLANVWSEVPGPVYSGFLVLHPGDAATAPELGTAISEAGLDTIDSVPPLPAERISWLNLFYAIEWVVFGGFAIFFWFRLTRDAWEKEHELKLLAQEEGSE
ncbi:SURF1 family protein [Leucobacter sp. GX24907]